MRAMLGFSIAALAAALACAESPAASAGWKIQYFYDEDAGTFEINDLSFSSPRHGVAVGFIDQKKGKPQPMSVMTDDGGARWIQVPLHETGVSIFFVNDSLGWMVTDKGIWRTEEGGRDWKKQKSVKGVRRVYFVTPAHGWAVGFPKMVLETTDGGRNWTEVKDAEKPATNPEYTSYNWISFVGDKAGIIIGASVPPRPFAARMPNWADPETASRTREWPTMTITLETRDSGKSWTPETAPAFGQTTRLRLTPDRFGLVLVNFTHAFEWPSEVYMVKPGSKMIRSFRAANRDVTDCAMLSPTEGLLAAIEPPGKLYQLGLPGKLRMLYSKDLLNWTEMKVPYQAFGTRATLSVIDSQHAWVATNTGMILRLQPNESAGAAKP